VKVKRLNGPVSLEELAAREPVPYWIPGLLPPSLNGPGGLIRMHHRRKAKLRGEIGVLVLAFMPWAVRQARSSNRLRSLPALPGRWRVQFTRRSLRANLLDADNLAASFKLLGDALVDQCVLTDDSPRYLGQLVPDQERVDDRRETGTHLLFEPMEPLS
jgi:hypothetical protein